MLVTGAKETSKVTFLDQVSCMYYSVQFCKDKKVIRALIDLGNKVNTMTLAYAKQLGLRIWKIDVGAQKIDRSLSKTFEMVTAGF